MRALTIRASLSIPITCGHFILDHYSISLFSNSYTFHNVHASTCRLHSCPLLADVPGSVIIVSYGYAQHGSICTCQGRAQTIVMHVVPGWSQFIVYHSRFTILVPTTCKAAIECYITKQMTSDCDPLLLIFRAA